MPYERPQGLNGWRELLVLERPSTADAPLPDSATLDLAYAGRHVVAMVAQVPGVNGTYQLNIGQDSGVGALTGADDPFPQWASANVNLATPATVDVDWTWFAPVRPLSVIGAQAGESAPPEVVVTFPITSDGAYTDEYRAQVSIFATGVSEQVSVTIEPTNPVAYDLELATATKFAAGGSDMLPRLRKPDRSPWAPGELQGVTVRLHAEGSRWQILGWRLTGVPMTLAFYEEVPFVRPPDLEPAWLDLGALIVGETPLPNPVSLVAPGATRFAMAVRVVNDEPGGTFSFTTDAESDGLVQTGIVGTDIGDLNTRVPAVRLNNGGYGDMVEVTWEYTPVVPDDGTGLGARVWELHFYAWWPDTGPGYTMSRMVIAAGGPTGRRRHPRSVIGSKVAGVQGDTPPPVILS